MSEGFASFREFYPFYLGEHSNRTCRRLHFAGTSFALGFIVLALMKGNAWWLLAALVSVGGLIALSVTDQPTAAPDWAEPLLAAVAVYYFGAR